jgi:hypothetical protein
MAEYMLIGNDLQKMSIFIIQAKQDQIKNLGAEYMAMVGGMPSILVKINCSK